MRERPPRADRVLTRRQLLSGAAVSLVGALAPAVPAALAAADTGPVDGSRIVTGDQVGSRILVVDPVRAPGTPDAAPAAVLACLRWTWSPLLAPELGDLDPPVTWRNVSEAKPRTVDGRRLLLCGASEGLALAVDHPTGRVRWAAVARDVNVHTLELLPDGDVAVAGSEPGEVRVYPAACGPRGDRFASLALPGARGLCWDAAHGVLWALGARQLVALTVGGTTAAPTLETAARVALPTPTGHDLDHVAASRGRLWVTTVEQVLQFDTATASFVGYPEQGDVDTPDTKSVGDDPYTGRILTTRPEPGNPCTWCTSVLRLHAPDAELHLPGTGLYKARWLGPPDA
ncbi:DUF6528 family protein [Streptacidiphilus jiangxiensis]|uniref:PQQ-like domain-containing protein n=1 Tax=Streptacidiphilus jiangxiensis TaxID=235985 RepID=A0A1H7QUE9_STRJI|nr:DUF6528 family protein [Streptacidiphilus jiangxiensis]SEL51255.1 hypothetical protein SAMN05414137_109206 [Streptacidiphilus jiangxiensis]